MQNLVNVQDFSSSIVAGDWAPAFRDAIAASMVGGNGGVFVPADAKPYTVKKPGPLLPSIDLRGDGVRPVTNFTLMGEGYGSVIQMSGSGGGGSWFMIHIGGHASDITIQDLFLDGNQAGLTDRDPQTHLIKIGGSDHIAGGANGVKILNCTLTRSFGDGIAILPTASPFGSGEEVSNVHIAFCNFINNSRSGISNQRSTGLIQILHNYFQGSSDQDIDLEPTGGEPGTGPSGYLILGNTFVRNSGTVCVTLNGESAGIPSSNNTFAHNRIRGGSLGVRNAQYASIVGNYIEGGLLDARPVVHFAGKVEGVRLADNHIVRPAGAPPGQLLNVSSVSAEVPLASATDIDATAGAFTHAGHGFVTGDGPTRLTVSGTLPGGLALETSYWVIRASADVFRLAATRADAMAGTAIGITDAGAGITTVTLVSFPRGVDVHDNRFHTYVPVSAHPQADDAVVSFTNAQDCSFRDNELHSYADTIIPNGLSFDTSANILVTVKGWDINGNRFGGGPADDKAIVFSSAIVISPTGVEVENIRINFNSFARCANQIFWTTGAQGSYGGTPITMGNNGDGIP